MTLATRKPSGRPSWPILLIAGVEQSGKTYAAAAASASDLIHRTLWIGVGEQNPEEYGAIPGARFEIVEHEGTYRDILRACRDAASEPPGADGKPNLIVLDSAGRAWALLSDMAQHVATERARKKAEKAGRRYVETDEEADIAMDLWNSAKQRWNHLLDTLRGHQGPSIVTARLDLITTIDAQGRPTRDKTWKVQAEKNLPYDVGATVQLRAYGEAYLTGVKSLRYRPAPTEVRPLEDFTVDDLWRKLGLTDGQIGPRTHATVDPTAPGEANRDSLLADIAKHADAAGVLRQEIADEWATGHDGRPISETTDLGGLELLRDDLAARPPKPEEKS